MTAGDWRVGRKVGRTIYHQRGPEPSDDDQMLGVMDTPALAQLVVQAVNESRRPKNVTAVAPGSARITMPDGTEYVIPVEAMKRSSGSS